jgi:hypothetical protein
MANPAAETISRRVALRRLATAGFAGTVGAGILELVAPAGASAQGQTYGRLGAAIQSGVPVITTNGGLTAQSCRCTGRLQEGHCNGPCPPGFFCYEVDSCGTASTKYACLNCNGTATCAYDCS